MNVTTLNQTVYVITSEDDSVNVTTNQDVTTYLEDVIAGTNVTIDKTDPKNPIISSSGSGGGGTWGSITGTLSDQIDLQAALNAKQATLVSGTNIKTINGSSILGSGDLSVSTVGSNLFLYYNFF